MKRRVVITGMGVVTPLGIGVEKTWERLCKGESGVGKITRFDASDFPVQIAAEVCDFDPLNFIDKKEVKKMDTFIQYSLASSAMALENSNLQVTQENAYRVGVSVGVGIGGLPSIERYHSTLLESGHKRISPFFIPMILTNLASGQVSIQVGAKGPNLCTSTACAAAAHAIGDAFRVIQRGDADAMVAGGAESVISPLAIGGFAAMRALSTHNEAPEKASRPFDRERDGFVMGEGSGILILEDLESAQKRGATIYGEIIGYGMSSDAHHITSPDPDGDGAMRCMKLALEDGEIRPEEIDYINAHGTSTPYNDKLETLAIKTLFGEHAYKLAVSSTKSMTGHLLGAAGAIEGVFTVLAIDRGVIPPTVNYEFPDPECDLDYVPNVAQKREIKYALSNSFGFGGTNVSLVFRKFEGS